MPAYNPPNNAFYTQVGIPDHLDPFKLMGHSGSRFKSITERSQADYIWYDPKRQVVEVWSKNHRALQKAANMLKRLMI